MVFMFFEDVNMLLPVETEYDEANNTVSATTDRVGTYCLMDMEMLFKNLGIEPDDSKTPQISTQTLDKAQIMSYNGNELVNQGMYSNSVKDNFDVVFMVDEINYTDEELSVICDKIYDTSKAIFNTSANVTVRVYGLNGKNKQTGCDFYGRTNTVNGLESILKKISHTELSADDLVDISRATSISEAIDYVALSYIISNIDDDQFKDNFNFEMNFSEAVKKASELGIAFDHEEFGFIFFDADRTNCNVKGFDTLFGIGRNSYNIKQSIVSNVAGIENKDEYKYSYARVLFDETEGMNFDIAANREVFVEDVIKYIYGKVPTEAGAYDAIIATGYSTVVLDKPLTEHDMELAEKRFDDPEYVFSDEEVKSCADTDRDGLFDFEEVMFYSDCAEENEFIKFKNGHIELPQVADIMRIFEVNGIYAYVDGGLEEARKQYGDCWAIFLTEPVLPIISDPTDLSGDGDGDGIKDIDEFKLYPLKTEVLPCLDDIQKIAKEFDKKEDSFILTCQFVRSFKYNENIDEKWKYTAGTINFEFISYIQENYKDIYNFYNSYNVKNRPILNDSITGSEMDYSHLFATFNSLCYNGLPKRIAGSDIVNDLSGWAGDLQSMMQMDLLIYYEDDDYGINEKSRYFDLKFIKELDEDTICEIMYNLLKEREDVSLNNYRLYNSAFTQPDLLADVDAVNLYSLYLVQKNLSVEELLNRYYSFLENDEDRFERFVRSIVGKRDNYSEIGEVFYKHVLKYTNSYIFDPNIQEVVAFTENGKWKLLKNAPVSNNVSVACAKAFLKYIFERAGRFYE